MRIARPPATERGTRTADQFIQVTRSMFSFAVNREIVAHNPLARVSRINDGESYTPWTDADCQAFEAINPPRWALTAYMLARYAAPRRGDVLRLTALYFHGLRHMCASALAELGASEHEIAAVTGHDDPAMVKRYTRKASQTALADAAIRRLESRK
jgi:site-specific recombinase XerD